MKRLLLFFCLIAMALSCARTDEDLIDSAKQEAKYLLTHNKCSDAKKALDNVGYQSKDALYIELYASTYGCMAGYSELTLFSDIGTLVSGETQTLGSLTQLLTSNETEANSDNYANIMNAIDILLNSGGGAQPSAAARNSKFGTFSGTDLNFQALYLIIVELGKFMAYYGNADGGVKGAGSLGNTCFFSYSHADSMAYINDGANYGGACSSATGSEGSSDLPAPATSSPTLTRLCEGIYLFNNFRDIIANVDVGDNTNFGALSTISSALEAGIQTAESAAASFGNDSITTVKAITSKSVCAELNTKELETWYAIVFETMFP